MNSDKHDLASTESNIEELVQQLRSWAVAYPESVFGPVTEEERRMYPSLICRNSAAMGRHCGQFMDQAADEIERLKRKREWIKVSERLPDEDVDGFQVIGCFQYPGGSSIVGAINTSTLLAGNLGRCMYWMPMPEPPTPDLSAQPLPTHPTPK